MKRKLPLLLGTLAALVVIAAGVLFWRDTRELGYVARFRASDPATREACAKQVLEVLDDAGIQRFRSRLRSEADDVRVLLVDSAKRAGIAANRLLPIFRDALRSANPSLRRWAVEEIGAVGTDGAALAPEIRTMLTDPSDLVRIWAEIALWKIAPDASGPPDPERLMAGG
jgi:HEAT repeat protein